MSDTENKNDYRELVRVFCDDNKISAAEISKRLKEEDIDISPGKVKEIIWDKEGNLGETYYKVLDVIGAKPILIKVGDDDILLTSDDVKKYVAKCGYSSKQIIDKYSEIAKNTDGKYKPTQELKAIEALSALNNMSVKPTTAKDKSSGEAERKDNNGQYDSDKSKVPNELYRSYSENMSVNQN